jgi:acyl-coenzyme A synthetase/AMP-(fatty) acid ligase
LTGGADVLATNRFSARRFWKTVKDEGVTVAFLHSPPVAVLHRATHANDAAGHRLRAVFLADEEFLKKFAVPMGFSAYGSTEAGGLCHIWPWRLGDRCTHPEGMSRFGGVPRRDVEWDLGDDGEILVRARRPHILSSGYRTASGTTELTDENGWFHTGDRGRRDENGHLVFIERKADSIRVKGEYVPIAFVEEAFAAIDEVEELALWRRDSELVDQEPILYVVASNDIPDDKIREVSQSLPRFMRPVAVVRVDALPRNEGVGKINRRRLETIEPLEVVELNQQR